MDSHFVFLLNYLTNGANLIFISGAQQWAPMLFHMGSFRPLTHIKDLLEIWINKWQMVNTSLTYIDPATYKVAIVWLKWELSPCWSHIINPISSSLEIQCFASPNTNFNYNLTSPNGLSVNSTLEWSRLKHRSASTYKLLENSWNIMFHTVCLEEEMLHISVPLFRWVMTPKYEKVKFLFSSYSRSFVQIFWSICCVCLPYLCACLPAFRFA